MMQRRILTKLDYMQAATNIEDLREPPGNHLHKLQGHYREYWSIAVNGPWRLVFYYHDNNIYDVDLLQYH